MNTFKNIQSVYLIGAGGIGVSALGRYFKAQGLYVAGYDKTPSPLTNELILEGIEIHFEDNIELIPQQIKELEPENVLVIFTPAVPKTHSELNYFRQNNYKILKRAEVLGLISRAFKTIAVAGTHGKTSVSTMAAHIFNTANAGMNAILGGISKNYNSNLILDPNPNSTFVVTEADEFDRSFLHLSPHTLVITSMDADHLDIYQDINDLHHTFAQLASQVHKDGHLILKKNLPLDKTNVKAQLFSYHCEEIADFYAQNIVADKHTSCFDIFTPSGIISDMCLQIPGYVNIENAVAAAAAAKLNGLSDNDIRQGLASWLGVRRRFEYVVNTPELVYIDDYAHHPEELNAFIGSVKKLYSGKILGIFQPHLYTRTRDFAAGFAQSLSVLDELILLDIYPAREEAIPGITSEIIFQNVTCPEKSIVSKQNLIKALETKQFDVILTMGAGDIDRFVNPIKALVMNRINTK